MQLPFLNPWMLAALPAVGIPVLIHLLNRHRSVTIEWGAMELLRKVMVFRSRQIRLEDLLLMSLRCLIIALVVLAVARPTTRMLPIVRNADTAVVVAVDTSMSMAHRPGAVSRFDQAGARVRDILSTMEPGRPVTLVAMGSRPSVVLRNVAYEPARIEEAIKSLRAGDEPLNIETCLNELKPLLQEMKAPRRELYLVTDAQAGTFSNLSDKAKATLSELSNTGEVMLAAVACAGDDNLAVNDLDLASGVLRVGAIAQFQATVRNHGRVAQDAGEVSLILNDQVVDRRFVGRINPGEAVSVRLYATLQHDGIAKLTARLGDDPLAADNGANAVVNIRSAMRVLCVDGDPMDRSTGRAAAMVATALAPATVDASEARPDVEVVPWTALPSVRLAEYDAIVLANVPDVPADRAVALRKYVEQGGGLMVLAGSNVKPEMLNQRFLSAGSSLLPAQVGEPTSAAGDRGLGTPLDLDLPDHPLARPLRSLPAELLSEARVHRFLRVQPLPDATTVLKLATGEPVLIERLVGRGKVLLWTSGAERDWSEMAWNNLAINPAFPIILNQSVTHLTRQAFERPVVVPSPVVLPLPGQAAGQPVETIAPGGQASVSHTALRAGEIVVETPAAVFQGFYELRPGRDAPLTVAANVAAGESDVKVLSAAELIAAIDNPRVKVLSSEANVTAAVKEARTGRELWAALLLAAVVLFAVEAMLARWYSRRGN